MMETRFAACIRGVLVVLLSIILFAACKDHFLTDRGRPVDLVEPLVDAANSRWFFFNSATRPFGMVNLSPDMVINGAWNSGYRYNQDTIRSFSHIHAWQMSGIPVLPTTGEFQGHLGPDVYGSSYSHEEETVKAGYHQIVLKDYGINAELTASTRVGFHRYTFPESEQSHILFDFSTFLGPNDTHRGYVKKVSEKEIEGYGVMAPTRRRPKPTFVYFVAHFDKDFDSFNTWKDKELLPPSDEVEGRRTGAFVSFSTKEGEVRQMKVAISYVSIEQARLNLMTEVPHWDFEKVASETRDVWNDYLNRIEIEGGSEVEQRRFYTDLWHALQGRRIISDVNGQYCDMTGEKARTGQIPLDASGIPEFNHYNSDSFWGAQWTLNTLWHLVYPEITEEFVNSMLMMYRDGGLIPRGPSGGNYTYVMTGASTTPFIVSAYMKGIRGFDIDLAYEGLRKNHMPGGLMSKAGYEHYTNIGGGLEYYIDRGYIPHPVADRNYGYHQDGSGQTLEYAYQDWTLSQLAKTLGKNDDYELFLNRSKHYENIWNDSLHWMWVKNMEGDWMKPIDILRYGNGWVEGNAAQYTWWVPQDVSGLIDLIGGQKAFIDKLNTSFEMATEHDFVSAKSHDAGETREFRRRYINYGNQPCMQTAFLFNYAGAPWLTQKWTRKVIDKVYSGVSPQFGYSGDEDQGLMGSLAAIMKMGLFEVHGGCAQKPYYELGSPIFDEITINLNPDYYPGGSFSIEVKNNSRENIYVQAAKLNEKVLDQYWFYHSDLINGGKLILEMGDSPNKEWASSGENLPLKE
jgi:predicted alpha-1,2-mannosidase